MIVCIAEKPSVARDIAEVLGAHTRKEGYIEGNGYQVTWTFGHLCTLKEPHEYTPNWKSWSLGSLPMIPPRFGIKLIGHYPGIEKQFHIIEQLMQNADEIINCGDAGQEGELIQRWVMQKAGARCPVKRLWISSLTEEAIREGFAKLKDQTDFQSLYEAGLSRAMGDWLLGMNATRLYTIKYGQNKQVLSIGRVQTPTLALIVNRQLEIANFQPKQYWELKTNYRDTTFSALIRKSDEEIAAEEEKNGGKPIKVVANLPYYITTPIIMGLFESHVPIDNITVMVQKEVADRMKVGPGSKDYGALSLAVQYYAKPYLVANVPANCFIPRPNVDSAVIRLTRHETPVVSVDNEALLFNIIRASFNQRRKTLQNGLGNDASLPVTKEQAKAAIESMGLSATIRGEALSLAQFAELANRLKDA